ncbi:MAG: aminoglycoside phosphotransferase family protein [Gaiellaceae bacterium MAG52_C11]|nr:aminoglycoside phosphotransferase family protein [Candidatus Gaiellasilicea maunaloa]
MSTWTDPSWLAEAHGWIRAQLARLGVDIVGEVDQHHVQPWATVIRVPTHRGDVYFKANAPALRYESGLVALLAERRPDCIPPLLAVDLGHGWMLMADAGTRLRELVSNERSLRRWLDILPLYAGLQLDLADRADEMVALGAPDLRLARLPSLYEQLLAEVELPPYDRRRAEASVARVRALCDELAGYGLPETIQHDDFHDGQVYVRDGRYLLLDWGDACVSHPFFTLSVTLEGFLSWGLDDVEDSVDVAPFRDAYLASFARFGERSDLEAAATIALRLGWVCRAVNARLGNPEGVNTSVHLRMFLDGRP